MQTNALLVYPRFPPIALDAFRSAIAARIDGTAHIRPAG